MGDSLITEHSGARRPKPSAAAEEVGRRVGTRYVQEREGSLTAFNAGGTAGIRIDPVPEPEFV